MSNYQERNPNPEETHTNPIILCIGVGGGGSNTVNNAYSEGIKDVLFVVTNTDQQALKMSPVPFQLQLGPNKTHGLGAGSDPEKGQAAAEESKEEIQNLFSDHIKMVFIIACMGGGTGTGASHIIAKEAREKGILVVGIVTTPFNFEGQVRQNHAEQGIQKLEQYCDTLIIIENQRIMDEMGLSLGSGFELVHKVLYEAITSVTDPINVPGMINIDFQDIDTMLRNAGKAVIGTGFAEGKDRSMKAIKQAVYSPLLRYDKIKGSTRLLLSVASGSESELTLAELSDITNYLKETLQNENIMVIWGHSYEEKLGSQIRISLIASGFPEKQEETAEATSPTAEQEQLATAQATHEPQAGSNNQAPASQNAPPAKQGTTHAYVHGTQAHAHQTAAPKQEAAAHIPASHQKITHTKANLTHEQSTPKEHGTAPEQPNEAPKPATTHETPQPNTPYIRKEQNGMNNAPLGGLQDKALAQKIERWKKVAQDYVEHIELGADNRLTDKEIKEMLAVPAYKRKNITLDYCIVSTSSPVRHHLYEEADNAF